MELSLDCIASISMSLINICFLLLSFIDKIASSISDLSSVMTHPSSKVRPNISQFPDPNNRHKEEVRN